MGVHGITRAPGTRTTTAAFLRVLILGRTGPAARRRAAWSNQGDTAWGVLLHPGRTEQALQRGPGTSRDTASCALRWYQADNGKPAENLDELVPKYLPFHSARSTYDGEPFRYRLLRGEEIMWPPESNAS